ncbi:MAG: amino acid adenylation domain-containing protein [Verrucomicrobia bacterium]|nr:amino acid adenylation domain-containing protein [Verrucomicrobiota bacterium]
MTGSSSLWRRFTAAAERFPTRPAVSVTREVAYAELAETARRIAATIQQRQTAETRLTAVFALRSETAYAGVLGALMAGHGYVPLNRTFPVNRTRLMLLRSLCQCVVVDGASEPQLGEMLDGIERKLVLILPERTDISDLAARFPEHEVIGAGQLARADEWRPVETPANSIAYLLFTSGSTGEPKGVMVSQKNVLHYVDYVTNRYGFNSDDRVSQTFDLTFDLSAHDMFVAWQNGACVCVPSVKQLMKPGAFIQDAKLTVWFSVPSVAVFMRRFGVLKPNMYPGLRLSLFCGEALPVEIVQSWRLAAPNSVIENIYGPTELTIACTAYRWDDSTSPAQCEQGIVPIGEPFQDMKALIIDAELREVNEGEDGELAMTGPQLTLGYWHDGEKTRRAFVEIPGADGTYYRTGDRVRRRGPGQPLLYLGRLDSQVKVLGHRVELGEVEAAIRKASGIDGVVALGWPLSGSGADGIEAFVQSNTLDISSVLVRLKETLPFYMVPRRIHLLSHFPLNANGKFDRGALVQKLRQGST